MADLFDGYGATATTSTGTPPWDEMFATPGIARASYKEIHATLAQMTQDELEASLATLFSPPSESSLPIMMTSSPG